MFNIRNLCKIKFVYGRKIRYFFPWSLLFVFLFPVMWVNIQNKLWIIFLYVTSALLFVCVIKLQLIDQNFTETPILNLVSVFIIANLILSNLSWIDYFLIWYHYSLRIVWKEKLLKERVIAWLVGLHLWIYQ